MKSFIFASVFIFLFFSLSISEVLVQEDFTNPVFPPPGWTIQTSGTGSWQRAEESGNGYAHGEIQLDTPSIVNTALVTNTFILSSGNILHFEFDRRNDYTGATPTNRHWVVSVNYGSTSIFTTSFPPHPTWTHYAYSYEIPFDSDQWNMSWEVGCELQLSQLTNLFYDVDNIVVETISVNVQPTSLGNIKAAFH